MKRFSVLILIFVSLESCNKDSKLIIPEKGVGNYILGEKLSDSLFNKDDLNFILTNKDSTINTIDIFSDKYYTKNKIRIGEKYSNIIDKMGKPLKEPSLTKGRKKTMYSNKKEGIPYLITYKGIRFYFNQKDSTVAKIRIFKIDDSFRKYY